MRIRTKFIGVVPLIFLLIQCSTNNPVFNPKNQAPSGYNTPFGYVSSLKSDTGVTNSECFKGKIYQIPAYSDKLPNFLTLSPFAQARSCVLNVPPQDWLQGFPGVTTVYEWFAISYKGNIRVLAEDDYHFALKSDDGARVFVDGTLVVDNDGLHPPWDTPATGMIHLSEGVHSLEVQYFQGPRFHVQLQLLFRKGTPPPLVTDSAGGFTGTSLNFLLDMSKIGVPATES